MFPIHTQTGNYAQSHNTLKILHQALFGNISSNFHCLCVVFMWVIFSFLLLWEVVHDKI